MITNIRQLLKFLLENDEKNEVAAFREAKALAVGHPPKQQGNTNFTNHMKLWKLKGLKFVPTCKPEENSKETAV